MKYAIQAKVIQDCKDSKGNAYRIGDVVNVDTSAEFRYYEVKDDAGAVRGLIHSSDVEVLGLKKN